MFDSEILELVAGLALTYFLLSVVCSAVREAMEAWFKTRGKFLLQGVRELLGDPGGKGAAAAVYAHPLIRGLHKGGELPSYIPSRNFAGALVDTVLRGAPDAAGGEAPTEGAGSGETLRRAAHRWPEPHVRMALLTALDEASGDLDRTREHLAAWFDSAMDRVSGWYRRRTHAIILAVAAVVTVGINVNTLTIIQSLSTDETLRASLLGVAAQPAPSARAGPASPGSEAGSAAAGAAPSLAEVAADYQRFQALGLPIGWEAGWPGPHRAFWPRSDGFFACGAGAWNCLFQPVLGWLLTIFAVSMGAPFWFDVLNKVMVVRSTVKPREKSPEEGSEDRPSRSGAAPWPTTGRSLPGSPGLVPAFVLPSQGTVQAVSPAARVTDSPAGAGSAGADPGATSRAAGPPAGGTAPPAPGTPRAPSPGADAVAGHDAPPTA